MNAYSDFRILYDLFWFVFFFFLLEQKIILRAWKIVDF